MLLGLGLLAAVVVILLNGFFVAAEFALVRAKRPQLEREAKDGSRSAARALRQIDRIDHYLAAAQVGITITSLVLGALAEPVIARLIEPAFGGLASHAVSITLATLIAFLLITVAHITVGEQAPKMLAILRAQSVVKRFSLPLETFRSVLVPLVWFVNVVSNGVVKLLGLSPTRAGHEIVGAEEIRGLITQGLRTGDLDPGEATMLSGVFHLHEQEARQVMTPLPAVVTVDLSENVGTALERCVASGHTRLPVTEDSNQDRIKGVVHTNMLVSQMIRRGPEASIDTVVRDCPIVPESRPLDDLLADLQRERSEMAIVIDEYGRTLGVVTVEDIVEEVVGEITDETDPAAAGIRKLSSGDWFVRGHVAMDDLTDRDIALPTDPDSYTSIGGFILDHLGRLPKRGDLVTTDHHVIRVEAVRENRVEAVSIRPRASDESEPTSSAETEPA